MCIIISKNVNAPLPTQKTLWRCWKSNPDGAGIVVRTQTGKLIVKKGLMEWEHFNNTLRGLISTYGSACRYLFHFRISTDGGIKRNLTHPFIVSERDKELLSLNPKNPNWVIMHNGIIPGYSGLNTEYSDTALYTKELASRVKKDPNYLTRNKSHLTIRDEIGNSRFVIISPKHFQLIGNWVKGVGEEKGLYLSHELYRVKVTSYKPFKTKKDDYGYSEWLSNYYNPYDKYKR